MTLLKLNPLEPWLDPRSAAARFRERDIVRGTPCGVFNFRLEVWTAQRIQECTASAPGVL